MYTDHLRCANPIKVVMWCEIMDVVSRVKFGKIGYGISVI